jgi:hypothetical protein
MQLFYELGIQTYIVWQPTQPYGPLSRLLWIYSVPRYVTVVLRFYKPSNSFTAVDNNLYVTQRSPIVRGTYECTITGLCFGLNPYDTVIPHVIAKKMDTRSPAGFEY